MPAGAPAAGSARGTSGFTAVDQPTAAEVRALNQALLDLLSKTSIDCKKILDAYPTVIIVNSRGGNGVIQSLTAAELETLSNGLRDLVANESPDGKKALAAHPSYNFLAQAGRGAPRGATGRGRAAASGVVASGPMSLAIDIPSAMELATLNTSLRNALAKDSPDAKKILDAHPTYQIMTSAGARATRATFGSSARGRGPATPPPPATGRGGRSASGNNGLGGEY